MLCTCLCNKAGHHGICQEKADPECLLAYPEIQLYAPGAMCGRCYAAVVRAVDAVLRDASSGTADVRRDASRSRADYGLARGWSRR